MLTRFSARHRRFQQEWRRSIILNENFAGKWETNIVKKIMTAIERFIVLAVVGVCVAANAGLFADESALAVQRILQADIREYDQERLRGASSADFLKSRAGERIERWRKQAD